MRQTVKKWINTGVSDEFGFIRNTRIRTINLAAFFGGAVSLCFSLLNLLSGNYLLSVINVATLLSLTGLFYCNAHNNFVKGPAFIMIVISAILCVNGLLFNNNMEFYVLLVVCLGLILFDDLKVIIAIIVCNSILFLAVYKAAPFTVIQQATPNRSFVNMALWLAILLVCLYYFKKQSLGYLKRLETVNVQLYKSNHAKEKLFSIVAHDMRSPLNSLSATLELLENEYIDEEKFKELSRLLSNQTKHLNENMEVLLKWAHSQLRGIEVHPQTIDVCVQVNQIGGLLQPLMKFKNMQLNFTCVQPAMVYADIDHVQLVLRNLLTNAIKFSHPGSVIAVTIDHTQPHEIWVHVKDSGIGITAEAQKRLFSNTTVTSQPGTQNEKGIGLGLQLSHEFITRNGGHMEVRSSYGQGSTFSFSLPAANLAE